MFFKNLIKQYPQFIFATNIIQQIYSIRDKFKKSDLYLIDAACGNGETTYEFSKLTSINVEGYDIEEKSIKLAKKKYFKHNLVFKTDDIFNVFESKKNVDFICLINSFFLLPNRKTLLRLMHNALNDDGHVFFIIPNIQGINYINFKKKHSDVNLIELTLTEFSQTLQDNYFEPIYSKGICYANIYGRKELKYLSIFSPIYLTILNYFWSFFKIGTPSYYLVMAKKIYEKN